MMTSYKSPNNIKCWIRRQHCPCGELKCYIKFEEGGDSELSKVEEASTSEVIVSESKVDVNVYPPYVGQTFFSDDDAFEYYASFAKKNGFAIRRESSKSSEKCGTYRRELVCYRAGVARHRKFVEPERQKNRKSTLCGCEGKMTIVKEFLGPVPQWTVKRFSNEHNHELLDADQLRLLPAYRKIPDGDRERILLLRKAGYSTCHIMKMLGSENGGDLDKLPYIERDVRNFIQTSAKKVSQEKDVSSLLQSCKNVQEKDASFLYEYTLDESGKLENIAWTYGDAVHAYEVFGDVVVFDTSYREITYDRLLAVWFGVDNHGKTIFFGSCLLQDETFHSFSWALQTFLRFMKGKSPQTMLADLDLGLRDAIIAELPNTNHAFCIWHIVSKRSSWFNYSLGSRYEEFSSEFTRLYTLDTVKDFECQWNQMVNFFGVGSNKHISLLFSLRESWALPYIRGYFHARMTTTECSKSIDAFLKEILSAQTCSDSFFEKVGMIVKYRNLAGEDEMEDIHIKTSMPIEEHASSILTPYAFNLLQYEIEMSLQFAAFDMPNGLYLVRHHKQMDGGNLVSWTPEDEDIHCSCKEFEFSGIICRHILRVLALRNYFHIPEKYLPIRWRRESSLVSKSTQNGTDEWSQAFHSLTTTLYTESSIAKERVDYVQAELKKVLIHVRNMQGGINCVALDLESVPQVDVRVANGTE
ncbi:hypothetical protein GIB67_013418 [Kingdonia uniflora]|uniref:Protein FAR1-RELATED SEQUENCE n=1 Tax=Kingdonia uniflora TaxID=39325 RepID=A0A7J7LR18_9MAGN|nr:hypothetical protein GIB67_013418 [Kingdonia uniflora]